MLEKLLAFLPSVLINLEKKKKNPIRSSNKKSPWGYIPSTGGTLVSGTVVWLLLPQPVEAVLVIGADLRFAFLSSSLNSLSLKAVSSDVFVFRSFLLPLKDFEVNLKIGL